MSVLSVALSVCWYDMTSKDGRIALAESTSRPMVLLRRNCGPPLTQPHLPNNEMKLGGSWYWCGSSNSVVNLFASGFEK